MTMAPSTSASAANQIHATSSERSRRRIRPRTSRRSMRGGCICIQHCLASALVLLLHVCSVTAQADLDTTIGSNSSTTSSGTGSSSTISPTTLTPLQVNVSSISTPSPSQAATAIPPPVLPPTTSYFSATAWFVLVFNLEAYDSNAGLMNDTQVIAFQRSLESLTQEFAIEEEWQKVVTMCQLVNQQQLTPETTILPVQTAQPTARPTLVPHVNVNVNVNLTFTPVVAVLNDTDTGQQPPVQALFALADSNTTTTTTTTPPPTTPLPTTPSPSSIPPTPLTSSRYFYDYLFQMTYLSSAVNVSQFPNRLEAYVQANSEQLTLDLQTLLELTPENNLQITTMEQVSQLTQAPTMVTPNPTIPPSYSTQPSSAPSVSVSPTTSPQPSQIPSIPPSEYPSWQPSDLPTIYPTFTTNISVVDNFALDFNLQAPEGAGYLNTSQEDEFCDIMVNQTYAFSPQAAPRVRTHCVFFADTYVRNVVDVPIPTPPPSVAPSVSIAPSSIQQQEEDAGGGGERTRRRWLSSITSFVRGGNPFSSRRRKLQQPETYRTIVYTYTYTFRMRYTSSSENVSDYTDQFQQHIAANAAQFNIMLTDLLGLEANNNLTLQSISVFETRSASPTYSSAPSECPTARPTQKLTPFPSWTPTRTPSQQPTIMPSDTSHPTESPTRIPTPAPVSNNDQSTLIIVVTVVALVATVTMAGMAWFYRTRRQSKLQQEAASTHRRNSGENNNNGSRRNSRKASNGSNHHHPGGGGGAGGPPQYTDGMHSQMMIIPTHNTVATSPTSYATHTTATSLGGGMIPYPSNAAAHAHFSNHHHQHHPHRLMLSPSTSESILSNPSLLSNGQDEDDDDDDDDDDERDDDDAYLQRHSKVATIDDFDQFKDQNLEKMRSDVECSVQGIDGMMSQALTRAILGQSVPTVDSFLTGNDGIEMEANALCEVTDWVKRHDVPTMDERQSFMQDMLNKVVTNVRQGIMGPDDASRTVHECAALLSLQLANDVPNTTVILTGMRKTVRANDVIRTFRKFGPIEDAAVASNQRGFGLVRFRSSKTVELVMTKFRTSEIVVQDVAVQCKKLEPDR